MTEIKRFLQNLEAVAIFFDIDVNEVIKWRDERNCPSLIDPPYDIKAISMWLDHESDLEINSIHKLNYEKLTEEIKNLRMIDRNFWLSLTALTFAVPKGIVDTINAINNMHSEKDKDNQSLNESIKNEFLHKYKLTEWLIYILGSEKIQSVNSCDQLYKIINSKKYDIRIGEPNQVLSILYETKFGLKDLAKVTGLSLRTIKQIHMKPVASKNQALIVKGLEQLTSKEIKTKYVFPLEQLSYPLKLYPLLNEYEYLRLSLGG